MFADCAALFGWRLGPDEVHTAMGFMPSNAVLLRDEASATMASRLGHGVAVATAGEMNLNTRKKNCKVFYMSAKDRKIALDIRLDCKQVWRPVGDKDLIIEGETSTGYDPAENPDNFRIVYHVWDDFPYQQADLIEGKAADHYGLGRPPDYTAYDEGENVRLAYLLNDTFELARAGAATMADRDGIKEQLAAFHAGTGPVRGNGVPAADPKQLQLLAFLQEHEQNPPEYFRPGEIAKALGVHPTAAGQVVQQLGHVPNVQRKGYPSELMYAYLDELLENAQ